MSNVTLTLGDFQFQNMEVPANIIVAAGQRAVMHKLIGGARVIDTMGPDPGPLSWSGMLLGSQALARALALKQMSDAGKQVRLSFSQFSFWVVITQCALDFEAEFRIPYQIICEIAADAAVPQGDGAAPGIDSLISGDMSAASGLTSAIGNSTLSGVFATLQGAVSAVSSFATAAQSTLNSVLTPLAAVQQQVKTLISAGENTLQNVSTLGGILPNNPIAQNVAKLSGQINAAVNQPKLLQLNGVLSRIGTNISALNTSGHTVTVMTGNLFDEAAKLYKNVEGWSLLSQANPQLGGDPKITAPTTLVVPPFNPTNANGGIPNV